eukprot:TRINITY_DN4551_c0_g1_i1.p1 TRINITY_DN4551_c0_g1~~TRINITY_DN4551_c0_g1_i1.p1  ORF type:complete len:128 (+),score=19.37 TRINITY_DN4551_c0_g1_i1:46-384(+)
MGQYGVYKFLPSDSIYLMRARVYNTNLGRFLSADPLGFTGSPYNLYSYTKNNPLAYKDPKGEALIPLVVAGGVIGGLTGAISNAIIQGINIYNNGGNFNWGDLGGAAVWPLV